ncbi:MAG: hypothetical protein NTX53_08255 [candidate division WOR-3 bacterium]|nr:hypothetical protein [candidate division WOR-3 bacterium]
MPKWTVVVALALSGLIVLAGAAYSVKLGNTLRFVDEKDYYAIAQNLVHGHGYSLDGVTPTAFRPPGYPLFLAVFIALGANVVVLRILNFVMLAASMLLLYRLVRRRSNWIGAVAAPVMCAGYVVLFYTAGTLYPQTLAGLLLVLVVTVLATRRPGWFTSGLLLGVLCAWLATSVVHFLFSLTVVAVWLLVARREWHLGARVGSVAIMAAVVALIVGLWLVRNQRVLGAPILTTGGGITLLYGNSEKAGWNSGASTDISAYVPKDSGLNEVELDAYYQRQAIDFIRHNKGRAIRLYALKVLNWFNYRNDLAQKSESSRARDLLMLVTYAPLLLLFIARLLLAGRMRLSRLEVLLTILYVSNAFAYAVWFTRVRFRLPYDLLLIAVVALFIGNLAGARRRTIQTTG